MVLGLFDKTLKFIGFNVRGLGQLNLTHMNQEENFITSSVMFIKPKKKNNDSFITTSIKINGSC